MVCEMDDLVDVQLFRRNGTWHRPDGAVRVDGLICAGGGGGGLPGPGELVGPDGEPGELATFRLDPPLPETMQVEIGRGGRGATDGVIVAGRGADGYALFVTHLRPVQ